MLSRAAAGQPLQARCVFFKSSTARLNSGSLSSSTPRQFSQLSRLSSPSIKKNPNSTWRTQYTPLSRPSIGGRAGASIPSIRFASTIPPSGLDLPTITATDVPDPVFTRPLPMSDDSHASSIVDRFLPEVPHMTPNVTDHPPDTMGYLSAIGLDNSWGPTAMMQNVIEAIHVYGGLPWWGTVIAITVTLRSVFLPLFLKISDNNARMKELQPLLLPYIERQRAALAAGDLQAQNQIRAEIRDMYKRAGTNPLWSFASFIQIPFHFGTFMSLRQIAYLPVPGLEHGGALWFKDLTIIDPLFILPVVSASFIYSSIHVSSADMPPSTGATVMWYLKFILPIASLGITCTMPSTLTLYFACSSTLAFIQSVVLRVEEMRRLLKIYRNKPPEIAAPLRQQNLSDSALARIQSDEAVIKQENERRTRESKGGIFSAAMGTKGGVAQGVLEHLKKGEEEAKHKNYEKKAKEEDELRRKITNRKRI
ncbi:hypothetical protein AA313_de0208645 [Arthrobotrys entomopaga]|nr:hypothetical protein AA313_de0208645 [Arthrobotrys entomopaga]